MEPFVGDTLDTKFAFRAVADPPYKFYLRKGWRGRFGIICGGLVRFANVLLTDIHA